MKLAYIERNLDLDKYEMIPTDGRYIDKILEYAANNSINVDTASKRDLFEDLYGSLGKYDGLILHLGIGNQKKLKEIVDAYPGLKIALISYTTGDYGDGDLCEGRLKLFEVDIPEDIFNYFKQIRIAYIDHRLNDEAKFSELIIDYAKENGIHLDISETIDGFVQKHGSISYYDGLIIHPGLRNMDALKKFREKDKDTKIAAVVSAPIEYEDGVEKVAVFDYLQREKIFDYFRD